MAGTAQPSIGPSGKTLAVLFVDDAGAPTDLKTLVGAPTLTVNGVPTVLSDPIWGSDSTHNPPTPYLPFVLYPLATPFPAGATATLTFPDGWASTVAGPVAGATLAVTSLAGASFLEPFDATTPRPMRLGTNLAAPSNSQVTNIFANITTQGSSVPGSDAQGFPSSTFPASSFLVLDGPADPTDTLNAANAQAGVWTVQWDGDHAANLTLSAAVATTCTLLTDVPGANGVNHTRTYQVTFNAALRHAPRISLNFGAAGASPGSVRVYPPGEPTDGSQLFGANLLRMAAGHQCIRFMDALWTNHSIVVDYADFAPVGQYSYYGGKGMIGGAVTSISPYTPPDNTFLFNPDWCSFIVTFAQPHGAQTGQILTFGGSIAGPNGNGTFPTTGGGITQPLYGGPGLIRVLDEFRVASHHYATGGGGTVLDTYAQPAGVTFQAYTHRGTPPEHCVALSNQVGADCWINVPHAATDACVTTLAQMIAARLARGLKCYVEYTNEHWNTGLGFEQFDYCRSLGLSMPGGGATATATVNSGSQVSGLTLTAPGAGYIVAPTVTIAAPAAGARALGRATLHNGTLGLVIDYPGVGYDPANPPAVTITAAVSPTTAYVWRAAQVHAIFTAAFTAAGRPGDLVRVMGGQYEFFDGPTAGIVRAANSNGINFDALAVAPYYDNKLGKLSEPNIVNGFNRLDVDMLHDLSQLVLRYGTFFDAFAGHRGWLDSTGFSATQIVCYEGGPQNGAPIGANDNLHRSLAWGRHPRMRAWMLGYLQHLQDAGCVLYCDYNLFLLASGPVNWPKYLACTQMPGLGDGSDGLFDNRTNYFDQSKFVAVAAGALDTWAALATPTAPTGPMRRRPRRLPTFRRRQLPRAS